jgi:hypothetical protein
MILLLTHLWGQQEKPLVKVQPLIIEGLGQEEARIIETLIHSYITGLGTVTTIPASAETAEQVLPDFSPAELPAKLPAESPADYTFSGSVTLDHDNRILIMEVGNLRTGETFSYTSSYKTTGELALKARALVESAFSGGTLSGNPEGGGRAIIREAVPETVSERSILGTWRGDLNIEIIRLQRGGRGIAIFSSGALMDLIYDIEGNTLKIRQNSPNTERYYYPAPYETAKFLAENAEPMRWELLLYENGTILRGIRIVSAYDGTVLNTGTARGSEWARTVRSNEHQPGRTERRSN